MGSCDMAFIEPMHRNKSNITYLHHVGPILQFDFEIMIWVSDYIFSFMWDLTPLCLNFSGSWFN